MPAEGQGARPRRGRPRNDETGQVDERILEAATALFLAQGFGRTTLDQVSEAAHTGKTTLYGRFPNKEALFAAVVRRSIETMFAELVPVPAGLDRDDRLRHAGRELARAYLAPRCIALIRMTGAEASNFPLLASMAYDFSMAGSAEYVAGALVESSSDIRNAADAMAIENAHRAEWQRELASANIPLLSVNGEMIRRLGPSSAKPSAPFLTDDADIDHSSLPATHPLLLLLRAFLQTLPERDYLAGMWVVD